MSRDHIQSTAPSVTGRTLVVGGRPDVQLAWCRLLGPVAGVSLLRWEKRRSAAEASRFCRDSYWLGWIDDGVARWRDRLTDLVRSAQVDMLIPADPLAHAVLCDGSLNIPTSVTVFAPSRDAFASGADRLRVFGTAKACGWRVLDSVHVATPNLPSTATLPCVVRPRHDVLITADEPARFSARLVTTADGLDAKLRDDVPRGEVLLQPATAPVRRLCVVAMHGTLVSIWTPDDVHGAASGLADVTRRLVAALDWNGVLELEYAWDEVTPTLIDLHCGGGAAFVAAVRHREPLGLGPGGWTAPPDPVPAIAASARAVVTAAAKVRLRLRAALWPWVGGSSQAPCISMSARILLVCKGNINRSIVAEHVLRAAGYSNVTSAALLGMSGRRPSRAAEMFILDELGTSVDQLRSQSVRSALDRSGPFDLVFCFERSQAIELADRYPSMRGRIHLLTRLAAVPRWTEISDPHGLPDSASQACFHRIERILVKATDNAARRAASNEAR